MKHVKNHKILLICTLCLIAGIFSGCKKQAPPAPTPPEVTVTSPVQKNVRRYYDLTGNIEAVESVDIQARVSGFLEKIHFTDGQDVKEGDLLFTIEQDVFKANVEMAKAKLQAANADLNRAEADLTRVEKAVKTGAVSEQEVDLKRADRDVAIASVAQAQAALDQANLDLSYTTVKSPISGRISRSYVDAGNLVGPGQITLLTRVVRFDPIYVYSNISETLLINLLRKAGDTDEERRKLDAKLYVSIGDEKDYPHEGILNYIDNKLDETTGTVQIRGELKNEKRLLYPGQFARIRVPALKDTEAILVKEKAIGTDLGGKFVLVVGNDNIVERRYVLTGQLYDNMRVVNKLDDIDGIKKGLLPEEHYIVAGIQRARPGLPVTPKISAPQEKQ